MPGMAAESGLGAGVPEAPPGGVGGLGAEAPPGLPTRVGPPVEEIGGLAAPPAAAGVGGAGRGALPGA